MLAKKLIQNYLLIIYISWSIKLLYYNITTGHGSVLSILLAVFPFLLLFSPTLPL